MDYNSHEDRHRKLFQLELQLEFKSPAEGIELDVRERTRTDCKGTSSKREARAYLIALESADAPLALCFR